MKPRRSWAARLLIAAMLAAVTWTGAALPATAKTWRTSSWSAAGRLVVKVNVQAGYSIADVERRYAVRTERVLLESRGIYLVRATRLRNTVNDRALARFSRDLSSSAAIVYAEPDLGIDLGLNRFHSWPEGLPGARQDRSDYLRQPLRAELGSALRQSTGRGVRVAVLDTGVDPNHPVLAGRLGRGYDYVDDDNQPDDVRRGLDLTSDGVLDGSYGHGTFASGLVNLVAPDATILPMRVLNSDGVGSAPVVAQAVLDAVSWGATVINLSFGANQAASSPVLDAALATARKAGVVVVAAAGNLASTQPLYPANASGVLSVGCLNLRTSQLAPYSSYGSTVAVAAPGDKLIGPMPGGGYATWSGTSMAAPIVSGQAALIRSAAPRLSATSVFTAITRTAEPIRGHAVRYGAVDVEDSLDFVLDTDDD